jgi:hypothetical protein
MKHLILLVLIFTSFSVAAQKPALISGYFERPLNCPLRFSNLSQLRDQIQTLTASLGNECSQSGQQALNQLRTSVANLEGIASTFTTFQGTDQRAQNAQLAKNAGQVLGSLNIITTNNACFYDIRARGALPVMSDIIMSISQLGLLVPSTTGALVATGGYIAGSGMKIINELVKKKFNWNRPEERRAFLQLNCAFFDNRKVMEEMGLFNPETSSFKEQLLYDLKKERSVLLHGQKQFENQLKEIENQLDSEISKLEEAQAMGVSLKLKKQLELMIQNIQSRPGDVASKWKQVSYLSSHAQDLSDALGKLQLEMQDAQAIKLMKRNLDATIPELVIDGKVWTSSIEEYEVRYRGPIIAFAPQILSSLSRKLQQIEALESAQRKEFGKRLSELRIKEKETKSRFWGATQRLISVESKIDSLETTNNIGLFDQDDAGKSDSVEILDYYRKLQKSILGKEGKGYLKNSLNKMEDTLEGLQNQLSWFDEAKNPKERCAAAEKLRFAWAEYRYKVQESFDFVATNMDLYRASFKIGKERQRRSTHYVLNQISSVEDFESGEILKNPSVGFYMQKTRDFMNHVEQKLQTSGCF